MTGIHRLHHVSAFLLQHDLHQLGRRLSVGVDCDLGMWRDLRSQDGDEYGSGQAPLHSATPLRPTNTTTDSEISSSIYRRPRSPLASCGAPTVPVPGAMIVPPGGWVATMLPTTPPTTAPAATTETRATWVATKPGSVEVVAEVLATATFVWAMVECETCWPFCAVTFMWNWPACPLG